MQRDIAAICERERLCHITRNPPVSSRSAPTISKSATQSDIVTLRPSVARDYSIAVSGEAQKGNFLIPKKAKNRRKIDEIRGNLNGK